MVVITSTASSVLTWSRYSRWQASIRAVAPSSFGTSSEDMLPGFRHRVYKKASSSTQAALWMTHLWWPSGMSP